MATQANVVLTDGAGTPVNHTFSPQSGQVGDSQPAVWLNRAANSGVVVGYEQLTQLVKIGKGNTGVSRVTQKLVLPTLAVTSPQTGTGIQPPPTLAYSNSVVTEYVLPNQGTTAERKNLRVMNVDLQAEGITVSAVENLEPAT